MLLLLLLSSYKPELTAVRTCGQNCSSMPLKVKPYEIMAKPSDRSMQSIKSCILWHPVHLTGYLLFGNNT